MAAYDPHHKSRWLQGLRPQTMEHPPSPSEPNYPSSGNQSPRSNTGSVYTSHDSSLSEDFFIEGLIPPYNPPIKNPLGPLLIQVALVPRMCFTAPIPTIPLMTNRSWDFVDTFGPLPFPHSTVSTTPLMENPAIPTMLGPSTIVVPNTSGTQYILVFAPFVSAHGPFESTQYSAPYSAVSMGPFSNPFG